MHTESPAKLESLRPWSEVLAYQNEEILHRFKAEHQVTVAEAAELFLELKRWLWLAAKTHSDSEAPMLGMDSTMGMMDEMWHTFILFTQDYDHFCLNYLGRFIHHAPLTRMEREEAQKAFEMDPAGERQQAIQRLLSMYEYIGRELGDATLQKWFEELPLRYHRDKLIGIEPPAA